MTAETETVEIEKVLNNGHGMARNAEGRVIFVPGALAGETYRLDQVSKRKGVFWAAESERMSDSAHRVSSPCPHFGKCGGCQLLHVSRDAEMDVKLNYLKDVLGRVGKINLDEVEIISRDFPIESSRIRGKFHVEAKKIGFKEAAADAITPVDDCLVIPDSIRNLPELMKPWCGKSGFKGEVFFAAHADGSKPVLEFVGRVDRLSSLNHFEIKGVAGALFKGNNGREKTRIGDPLVRFEWNHLEVALEPSQFFQSNPASWPLFFEVVNDYREMYNPQHVWDVHAGAGFLSSCFEDITLYCSEPESRAYRRLEKYLGEAGALLYRGTAEEVLDVTAFPLDELDGVVLDPPRSGLSPELRSWLVDGGPHSLLYVSCDLGSFARDLKELCTAYAFASPILAMNVNPGTLRLELAVILERLDEAA